MSKCWTCYTVILIGAWSLLGLGPKTYGIRVLAILLRRVVRFAHALEALFFFKISSSTYSLKSFYVLLEGSLPADVNIASSFNLMQEHLVC